MKFACALVIHNDRLLICNKDEQVCFPLGELHPGESFQDAALRNIRDNLSLEGTVAFQKIYKNESQQEVGYVFIKPKEPNTSDKYQWLKWSEVPVTTFQPSLS